MMGLLIQLWLVKRIYSSSKRVSIEWDELLVIDDINSRPHVLSVNDGSETKFLRLLSDDEKIEFDSNKLENKKSSTTSSSNSSRNSPGDKSPV